MFIFYTILVLLALLVVFGLILVIKSTIARKGKFGLNLQQIICQVCEGKVPAIRIRKPKSTREFLWGGSVCENCGCELNKWGEKVSNSTIIGDKYAEKIRLKEAELGSFIDDEVNRRQFELDNQRNKIT